MAKKQKNASPQAASEIDHTAQLGSDVDPVESEAQGQPDVTAEQPASAANTEPAATETQPAGEADVPEPAPRNVPTLSVRQLTREECNQELARLGDPIADRKTARRAVEALIARRDEKLKELNREIGLAEDEYRIIFARAQEAAERIRKIKEVQIPALDAAAAKAAAQASNATALPENGSEPLP